MIINAETLKNLKQINVSADREKTMSRVKQLWVSTPVNIKKKVLAAVKTGDATIYRVFRTGTITPRGELAQRESVLPDGRRRRKRGLQPGYARIIP